MIYFVQPVDGGPVKIGYARDARERLRALQCGSPVPLRIVAEIEGDARTEAQLHDRFRAQRLHGEWFDPRGPIAELIAGLKEGLGVTYAVSAPAMPTRGRSQRRMPPGRWLARCRSVVEAMDDGQWRTARELADSTGAGRDAWRCLELLHRGRWVEKRVATDRYGRQVFSPKMPHRWRLVQDVHALLAARAPAESA